MATNKGRMSKAEMHQHLAAKLRRQGKRAIVTEDGVDVVDDRGNTVKSYKLVEGGPYGWKLEER